MGRKMALMVLMVLLMGLLVTAASARFEGVRGPGMYYGGFVGGERFEGVHGPTMRYDGYHASHAYFFGLDKWISIAGESSPYPDLSEMVRVHQERFTLAGAVFGIYV
ncbi:hypothetical protein [Candidatus Methanocrinis natronophilus]|uniref:Uncharacterized protein n=1 Tax=Candidatus Methanocrinis natronophilus TaxID=3033396 RepID=A0ABT5X6R4_9EURY|nr:hypothetical protein [Candidatus Methanocrinis natronophilus]MDF0590377.1 hypothetical protein [Candidatus Methanocrinis natronophilus]